MRASVPDRLVRTVALAEPAFRIAASTKRKQEREIDLIFIVAPIADCTVQKAL
jgi:hypothetical protein